MDPDDRSAGHRSDWDPAVPTDAPDTSDTESGSALNREPAPTNMDVGSKPMTGREWSLHQIGYVMYVVGTAFLLLYFFVGQSIDALGGDPTGGILVAIVVAVLGAIVYLLGRAWDQFGRPMR